MTKQQQTPHDEQQNQKSASTPDTSEKGDVSVREAGQKGGQRERELVDEGKASASDEE